MGLSDFTQDEEKLVKKTGRSTGLPFLGVKAELIDIHHCLIGLEIQD